MGLLVWTSATLFILSMLSFSFFSALGEQRAVTCYIGKEVSLLERNSFYDLSLTARNEYFKKAKDAPNPPEKKVPRQKKQKKEDFKPRLISKIHINAATFIALKDSSQGDKFAAPGEQLLYHLLQRLYKDIGSLFHTSDQEAIHLILYSLAEAFSRYEGKYINTNAKILANFELSDQDAQEGLWNMLHGRKKGEQEWPSLLSYISFKKEKFLTSLWLAPEVILLAIFDKEEIVDELMEKRTALYKAQRRKDNKDNEQTSQLEGEWRTLCEKNLPTWLPNSQVDLRISKTAPPT
jgi:hypothetical protein